MCFKRHLLYPAPCPRTVDDGHLDQPHYCLGAGTKAIEASASSYHFAVSFWAHVTGKFKGNPLSLHRVTKGTGPLCSRCTKRIMANRIGQHSILNSFLAGSQPSGSTWLVRLFLGGVVGFPHLTHKFPTFRGSIRRRAAPEMC